MNNKQLAEFVSDTGKAMGSIAKGFESIEKRLDALEEKPKDPENSPSPTESINQTAARLSKLAGWVAPDGYDFLNSENPRAIMFVQQAECAYESITGDTPDYAEE